VVSDQTGSPTYGPFLADLTKKLLETHAEPGLYHAAGPDPMTWYEFALRVIRATTDLSDEKIKERIHPIETSEWPTAATRPKYSVLNSTKLSSVVASMPPIEEALSDFALCVWNA
jgi:dTDP-4-dehydrorhamnose reductase